MFTLRLMNKPPKRGRFYLLATALFLAVFLFSGCKYKIAIETQQEKLPELNSSQAQSYNNELTKDEINEISKSIISLECLYDKDNNGQWDMQVYGSGTYISKSFVTDISDNEDFNYVKGLILTNGHVAQLKKVTKEDRDFNFCTAILNDPKRVIGMYKYDDRTHFLTKNTDMALLSFGNKINKTKIERPYVDDSVLKTSLLRNYPTCKKDKIVGTKAYIFGYPGSAFEYTDPEEFAKEHPNIPKLPTNQPFLSSSNLIVTEGMVSGIDSNGNYFTDAKIDTGNSGGLAISKIDGQICILGIPTWVSEGQLNNLGMIQSFDALKVILKTVLLEN